MSDYNQTTQKATAPLPPPPTFMGRPSTLLSLCLGLPIVSTAIFGAGLWLGHLWYRPSSSVSPVRPDAPLAADGVDPTPVPVATALQQDASAPSLATASPLPSDPASRHAQGTAGRAPKHPLADRAMSPTLPGDLWPDRFAPEVEGWRVIQNSQNPEDVADFIAAFPTSRFAAAARARLHQLQSRPSPALSSMTPLQVRYAQVSLRLAGFDPGPLDGLFGQQTLLALRQYQASRGLPVTGTLDAATQQALQMPSRAVLQAWQQAN
jgi:hypothetical protein